ncbi:OLC1v1031526C1 [Oldenlandia corymbosa var. corymbosa]|nr:OLC1v1031526C1 [Oldenlandia corymbosa var. corymbosa]
MESVEGEEDQCNQNEQLAKDSITNGQHPLQHHHHYHHHHQFVRKVSKSLVLFSALALAIFVVYHSSKLPASLHNSFSSSMPKELVELSKVMEKTAMKDKTVVITTLNEAWAVPNSIFDLFLESFKIGNQTKWLLNHLVVVALDQKAYDQCLKVHPNCYKLKTEGIDFSSEAYFMTKDYLKMMWRRILFLQTVLDLGYNFIFTDADIMWFRDPFPHFHADADFQIACDYFRGNSSNLNNSPNGGFTYVRSNQKTRQFYRFWYVSRNLYPNNHDQDVLNRIKHDPFLKHIGLQIRFLETKFFGGFCQRSEDFNLVCTMHANCCVGLDNKIYDLKIMLDDWRKYMSKSRNGTSLLEKSSWNVPQHCGPASFRPRRMPKNGTQGGT